MKKLIIGLIAFMAVLIGGVVYVNEANKNPDLKVQVEVPDDKRPVATIDVEGYGEMTFELYPMQAPQTVYNFIELANKGFYDGLTFHRIVNDFVIQGGDPSGDGTGGPGYSITGEFAANGYDTGLKHEKGAIAMARGQESNSAGSQFYINTEENANLEGSYAVFGYITSGEDVLEKLNLVETDGETPVEKITIKSIKVDTKGITYPEAEKM